MSDYLGLITAALSAIATALAAYATWQAPRSAAKLSELLRLENSRAEERRKQKLEVFLTLMQERSAIYSQESVRALNLIDVVYSDSREVREAWAALFLIFNTKPIPNHVLEERLRVLLLSMSKDIGLDNTLRTDDIGRIYTPQAIGEERAIKDMQRKQLLAALQSQGSPASNTVQTADNVVWPPPPD